MDNLKLAKLSKEISNLNQFEVVDYINKNLYLYDSKVSSKVLNYCNTQFNINIKEISKEITDKLKRTSILLFHNNYSELEPYLEKSYEEDILTVKEIYRLDNLKLATYVEHTGNPIKINIDTNYINTRISSDYLDKFFELYDLGIIYIENKLNKKYTYNEFSDIVSDCFTETPCFQYDRLELTTNINSSELKSLIYYFIDKQVIFLFKNCKDIFETLFPKHVLSFLEGELY